MAELKYLDNHNDGHDVHESCVKLEVFICWANVVTSTQHSFKYQS